MMSKKLLSVLICSAVLLVIPACEEEAPFIDFTPKDYTLKDSTSVLTVTPAAQPRNVLIEDFTGVRCNNCPNAQAKAAQIDSAYPGRVVIMALHPSVSFDNFTFPYNASYDFRTDYAEQIMNMLVPPPALPYGVVNRKLYSGESSRMIEYQKWEQHAIDEMALSTPVNIDFLEKKLSGGFLYVTVKLTYTQPTIEHHSLSIALTESHIVAPQKQPDLTTKYDYEHNHVLRTMGTLSSGTNINKINGNPDYEKGRIYVKEFKIPVQGNWKLEKCHIAAFVTRAAPDLTVVHAAQTDAQ